MCNIIIICKSFELYQVHQIRLRTTSCETQFSNRIGEGTHQSPFLHTHNQRLYFTGPNNCYKTQLFVATKNLSARNRKKNGKLMIQLYCALKNKPDQGTEYISPLHHGYGFCQPHKREVLTVNANREQINISMLILVRLNFPPKI